jgi:hypothetical protein
MEQAELSIVVLDATKKSFASRVLTGTLLAILLCLAALSHAGAARENGAFEQSGINFPDGFDLNTVGDLRGRATGFYRPAGGGPVVLNLETEWEKYAILTCPPWYWDELKIKVSVGEEVRVIGSKSLGKDSRLYIVAQEIHFIAQRRSVTLRNKAGTPLWGARQGSTDSQRGSGNRTRGQK